MTNKKEFTLTELVGTKQMLGIVIRAIAGTDNDIEKTQLETLSEVYEALQHNIEAHTAEIFKPQGIRIGDFQHAMYQYAKEGEGFTDARKAMLAFLSSWGADADLKKECSDLGVLIAEVVQYGMDFEQRGNLTRNLRNLLFIAQQSCGDNYDYLSTEEQMTMSEAKSAWHFWDWLRDNNLTFGHGNIDEFWNECFGGEGE